VVGRYWIYIIASDSGTLYLGVTNDLPRRIYEHKNGLVEGFSKKYKCHRLVYFEEYAEVKAAISREKQLKKWNRRKKEILIGTMNPHWSDLMI